jgi:hypothetical protein
MQEQEAHRVIGIPIPEALIAKRMCIIFGSVGVSKDAEE